MWVLRIFLTFTLLCSCSQNRADLDPEIIEEAIPRAVLEEYSHLISEVRCPEKISKDLDIISCVLTVEGKTVTVSVMGPDVTGSFVVNPRLKMVSSDELAQKIKERLDDDLNIENSIKCSPEIRVAHPGEIFECEIIDPQGGTHYLDAEIVDYLGGFEILSRSE